MDPAWVEWETVLRPFRKKGADFALWHSDPKYREASLKIRAGLNESATLVHIDYEAAANPKVSGRPLEIFLDASD